MRAEGRHATGIPASRAVMALDSFDVEHLLAAFGTVQCRRVLFVIGSVSRLLQATSVATTIAATPTMTVTKT